MIYRAVGWLLTAAAGLRNWMLVGCFREEKVVTGTETVGEFWVVGFFFILVRSASGSGRVAGNMQRGHANVGVRRLEGKVSGRVEGMWS